MTGIRDGVDGARASQEFAEDLKRRMLLTFDGEPHCEIVVRWTSPDKTQPRAATPEINDDVHANIHSFMTAEILRHNKMPKLKITRGKDRGKSINNSVLFKAFERDRINDHHLTLAEKMKALGDAPC